MNEFQHALNVIAERLQAVANDAGQQPHVNFEVEWMEVTTVSDPRRQFAVPRITIKASVETTVNIADL